MRTLTTASTEWVSVDPGILLNILQTFYHVNLHSGLLGRPTDGKTELPGEGLACVLPPGECGEVLTG